MLRTLLVLALGLALVPVTGCEEKKEAPAPAPAPAANAAPAPQKAPPYNPNGPQGDVKGVVTVTGKLPEMPELKRGADPVCAKKQMKDEEVVAKDGKLKNVLIHINGAPATEPPKEHAVVNQEDCMYRPRVMGVVTGQPFDIKNSDPTLHNVHTYKGASTMFNQAQVPQSPDLTKTFNDNGVLLKLKCDVHQWMTAYVWVQNNPWFAVTGDDGSFTIKGVPAGKYEIEAWHERFGNKKGEVTVEPGKPAEVKLEYNAEQPSQPSK